MVQRLKLSRAQLSSFLNDAESIKQFENLFATVDEVRVVGGGDTYVDIPQASPATIYVVLARILAQLEAVATAYPGADKSWSQRADAAILTRLEALETEYPGNTKAWVMKQKFQTSFGFTPINKAGDTQVKALSFNAGGPVLEAVPSTPLGATYFVIDQTVNGGGKRYRFGHTGGAAGFGTWDVYNQTDGVLCFSLSPTGDSTVPGKSTSATTQSTVYTVATLPAGVVGMRAFVSNALGPAFGAAVVGGGAVQVPVYYDGAWKVG